MFVTPRHTANSMCVSAYVWPVTHREGRGCQWAVEVIGAYLAGFCVRAHTHTHTRTHTRTRTRAHTLTDTHAQNGLDDINYRRKWHNWTLALPFLSIVCVCVCARALMCDSLMKDCKLHTKHTRSTSVRGCNPAVHWVVCLCVCVCVCVCVSVCVLYAGRCGCHPSAPSCADTQLLILFSPAPTHPSLPPFSSAEALSPRPLSRPGKSKQ